MHKNVNIDQSCQFKFNTVHLNLQFRKSQKQKQKHMTNEQPFTLTIRQLTEKIESQIHEFFISEKLTRNLNISEQVMTKQVISKLQENIRDMVITNLSNKIPKLVARQQFLFQATEDAKFQAKNLQKKYQKIKKQLLDAQLQVDRLKLETISLSQSYENAVVLYEKTKVLNQGLLKQEKQRRNSQGKGVTKKRHEQAIISQQINKKIRQKLVQKAEFQTQTEIKLFEAKKGQAGDDNSGYFDMERQLFCCQKDLYEIQIRQSQQRITLLEQKMNQMLKYQQKIQLQLKDYEIMIQNQQRKNATIEREMYNLINETESSKVRILEEHSSNIKLKQEIGKAYSQNKEEKTRNQELEKKICQYETLIKNLVKSEKQKQRAIDQKQKRIESLSSYQTSSIQQIQKLKQSQKAQLRKVATIEKVSNQFKQKYEKKFQLINQSLKDYQEKNKQYKYQNQRLYQRIALCQKRQAKDEARLIECEAKIKKYCQEKSEMKNQIDRLRISLQLNASIIQQSKKEQKLTDKIRFKHMRLTECMKKIVQKNHNLINLLNSLKKQTKQNIQSLKAMYQKTLVTVKGQISNYLLIIQEKARKQLIQLKEQLSKNKTAVSGYQNKYFRAEKQNKELLQQLDQLQNRYGDSFTNKDKKLSQLLGQLDQQKTKNRNLLNQVETLSKKVQKLKQIQVSYKQMRRQNLILKNQAPNDKLWKTYSNFGTNYTMNEYQKCENSKNRIGSSSGSPKQESLGLRKDLRQYEIKSQKQKARMQSLKMEYQMAMARQI